MGIKLISSFAPIMNKFGINIKNEIKIPFNIEFIFMFDIDIIKPDTIHRLNADKLASKGSFCIIIGMASIIPAMIPSIIPK